MQYFVYNFIYLFDSLLCLQCSDADGGLAVSKVFHRDEIPLYDDRLSRKKPGKMGVK